jgi:predicted transcriptional regulator of viral defense system
MNSKDIISKLNGFGMPVFSLETLGNIMQKPIGYVRIYASRMYKKGIIDRIENGLYCLPGTDEYTIASRIIPYSYITSYAALNHYGLTSQTTTKLQVVSSKYHRPVKLANYEVNFIHVKKDFIYGYAIVYNGPSFAEPEKIFVDDLYLHKRQYYAEEFEEAIKRNKLDIPKFKDYAIKSGNKAVVSMAGHYLESYGVAADDMLAFKSAAYLNLGSSHGSLDSKWKIRA